MNWIKPKNRGNYYPRYGGNYNKGSNGKNKNDEVKEKVDKFFKQFSDKNKDVVELAENIAKEDGKDSRNKAISVFTYVSKYRKKFKKMKDKDRLSKEILIDAGKLRYVGSKNKMIFVLFVSEALIEIAKKLNKGNFEEAKEELERLYLVVLYIQAEAVKR